MKILRINKRLLKEAQESETQFLDLNDDFVKEMVGGIVALLRKASIGISVTFRELAYNYEDKRVVWGGTLNGNLKFRFVYSTIEQEMYVNTEGKHIKMDSQFSKAVHVLSTYFKEKFVPAVIENLADKTF